MDSPDFFPSECDVVMEGGVTSGVVYPTFVVGLAKRFRLRSIGGTSVGAIAAIAAAAAQFRKNLKDVHSDKQCNSGFEVLADLPNWLGGGNSAGQSNLFSLFQPCDDLNRHFTLLSNTLNHKKLRNALFAILKRLVFKFPIGAASGAGVALLVWAISIYLMKGVVPSSIIGWLINLAWYTLWLSLSVIAGAVLEFTITGLTALRKNKCGICSGMSAQPNSLPALTEWMHGLVQEIAGLPSTEPLTFDHLKNSSPSIELALMTTGLSELKAHKLPYASRNLIFRLSDLSTLFPQDVLDWMIKHSPEVIPTNFSDETIALMQAADPGLETASRDYYFMPEPGNLPVVVAARMSLSFPILLQAIPLYRIRFDSSNSSIGGKPRLMRVWFTDGGLTSNFPIHFFDSLLPTRPTFGITLQDTLPINADPSERIYLPSNNIGGITAAYVNVEDQDGNPSIFKFFGAVFNTVRNWRDEALKRTPGFRDRVVQIKHTKEEGGLNLNMPAASILAMSNSGNKAAEAIINRFLNTDINENAWMNHRWVRMRSAASSLHEILEPMVDALDNVTIGPSYRSLWISTEKNAPKSYKLTPIQRQYGFHFWQKLSSSVDESKIANLSEGAPKPRPSIAITPSQT